MLAATYTLDGEIMPFNPQSPSILTKLKMKSTILYCVVDPGSHFPPASLLYD